MNQFIELASLNGGIVVGLSFPTPSTFEMKCLQFRNGLKRSVVHFDLVFLRVENVHISNKRPLAESLIAAVDQDPKGEQFKFDLGGGTISVKCESMQMLRYES